MAAESTIAIQIRTALAQHLKRDVSKIRPQDRLREDLGLDSLAMIELLFKIEEHFDLEIPNEDLSRVTTVGDVTAYVEEKLAASGKPAAAPAPAPRAVEAPTPLVAPAPAAAVKPAPKPAARSAGARPPAKVTSIVAAAKRKAEQASKPAVKKAAAKKKGTRGA